MLCTILDVDRKVFKKDKRSKWEIYHDILTAINNESAGGDVRPTRIQFQSNMSYNNLIHYLTELENRQMIKRDPISLTQKGFEYFRNCSAVKELVHKLGLDRI